MGAFDRVLEARPIAFDRVDVMYTLNPLVGAVIDRAVLVRRSPEPRVALEFVGADGAAANDVVVDDRL